MGGFFCVVGFQAMAAEKQEGISGEMYHIPDTEKDYCNGSAYYGRHNPISIANNSQRSFGTVFFPTTNVTTSQSTPPKTFLGNFQLSHYSLFKIESDLLDDILRC